MTKEDYIKVLLTALISVVAKGIFDKLVSPYIPMQKKFYYFLKILFFVFFSIYYLFTL
jgi:hypothetical protein